MYTIDTLTPLRIRKDKIYYPYNQNAKDKYHDSAVFILTKNMTDTINFLNNNKFLINMNTFISYYIEKNFNFIIHEANTEEYKDLSSMLESHNGENDIIFNNYFIQSEKNKLFYPDAVDKIIFSEDFGIIQNYSNLFRKFLYEKRIKNQGEILFLYDKIKKYVPFIKNTYLSYPLYRRKNLIIDWSTYTQQFFINNPYKMDKGIDLFHHFITHFINDPRIDEAGYTKKTVIIPINSWVEEGINIWDRRETINPFSMIERLIRTKKDLGIAWENINFLFCSDTGYFKVNFSDKKNDGSSFIDISKLIIFKRLVDKLASNSTIDSDDDDVEPVIKNIIDADKAKPVKDADMQSIAVQITDTEKEKVLDDEALTQAKNAIDSINVNAQTNQPIDEPEPLSDIPEARKIRIKELKEKFNNIEVDGEKIGDVLDKYYTAPEELKKDNIPIDSINENWKNVTFSNFDKDYNIKKDIIAIFDSLTTKANPISIISIEKKNTSTFEDYIDTYTIKTEDKYGTRSELNIDIPRFINNRYMKLRGNLKILNGQLFLIPIIKTAEDTSQIVTNYNKIMIYRVNPSNGTKSTKGVNKLTKAIKKYSGTGLEIYEGDNSLISQKYNLPVEYRDLSSLYTKIICKNDNSYITLDMDEALQLESKADMHYNKNTDTILGYDTKEKKVIYSRADRIGYTIGEFLSAKDKDFAEIYKDSKPSNKLSYADASVLSCRIPVIVVMAYADGLERAMHKAGIKYSKSEKRPSVDENHSLLKFSDGYILYEDRDPKDSLLMSGIAQVNTIDYSLADINSKNMWLTVLDDFGGRLRADGLDNFKECLFDPMTIDICKRYKLPYDYTTALGYAAGLLADTEYNKHTDLSGNRIRTNELIAGYLYKAISKSYGDYANSIRHRGKGSKITVKQNSVIDNILLDPGCSDLSVLNPLLEAEAVNTLSFKGLSGMNSDRSYTLDKRIYDKSMVGVIGMSTGFSANSGITRIATINSQVKDIRGTIDTKDEQDMNTLNMLTVYEAMAPYGTTHDDPMRTAMGYIQTTKHQMRVKESTPNLVTYGTDEALPYLTSNIFSYKFKGKKGKVLDVTDKNIIYKNLDDNSIHMISLDENVMKNSDGGFYVTVKLDPLVKKGQALSYNTILAYDSASYSKANASNKNQTNIAYNIGTLAKVAIMVTDEAYEDSSIIDERLSDAMTSTYCVQKSKSLPADTNVYNLIAPGTPIKEGDPLLIFQTPFSDKDANELLRNISDDEIEMINDFGRIQVHSKLTGIVQDIKIYRTCELSDLSPSLKRIVSKYESNIKKQRSEALKYGVSKEELDATLEPDYKLEQKGKLKATENGVLIEFYIKCNDKMGVGDKLTYNTAIKGVIKDIINNGDEPFTDYRPNEKIDALLTTASVNARMATSIILSGALNKVLIETSRKCKEILGIKWNNLGEHNKK